MFIICLIYFGLSVVLKSTHCIDVVSSTNDPICAKATQNTQKAKDLCKNVDAQNPFYEACLFLDQFNGFQCVTNDDLESALKNVPEYIDQIILVFQVEPDSSINLDILQGTKVVFLELDYGSIPNLKGGMKNHVSFLTVNPNRRVNEMNIVEEDLDVENLFLDTVILSSDTSKKVKSSYIYTGGRCSLPPSNPSEIEHTALEVLSSNPGEIIFELDNEMFYVNGEPSSLSKGIGVMVNGATTFTISAHEGASFRPINITMYDVKDIIYEYNFISNYIAGDSLPKAMDSRKSRIPKAEKQKIKLVTDPSLDSAPSDFTITVNFDKELYELDKTGVSDALKNKVTEKEIYKYTPHSKSSDKKGGGLSTGAIVGIVVACVVVVAAIIVVVVIVVKKKKSVGNSASESA